MSEPLIVCCGQRMRGDDAAGPEVAARLRVLGLPAVESTCDAADLIGFWSGHEEAVVVDAVRTGGTAGTLHGWDGLTARLERDMFPSSTQTPGVAETVALGRTLGRLPRRLVIVGVEAERFEFGAPLSPAVEQALEPLVRLVVREFEACRTGSQAGSASA